MDEAEVPKDRLSVDIKPHGAFTYKRPNLGDQIEVGRRQAIALRGTLPKEVDDVTAGMAYIVAVLGVCVVGAPEAFMTDKAFVPEKMYDTDVLMKIYEPFRAWVESFRPPSEDSGPKKSRQAGK